MVTQGYHRRQRQTHGVERPLGRPIPAIEVVLTAINATKPLAERMGLKPGAALLVDYELVPVGPGAGPHPDGTALVRSPAP